MRHSYGLLQEQKKKKKKILSPNSSSSRKAMKVLVIERKELRNLWFVSFVGWLVGYEHFL